MITFLDCVCFSFINNLLWFHEFFLSKKPLSATSVSAAILTRLFGLTSFFLKKKPLRHFHYNQHVQLWWTTCSLSSFSSRNTVPTEMHRIAPSCTEYHRVTLFLIDILLICTEYHRVTHFCLLYSWFAPSCTELHRVAPSTTELVYF